MLEWMFNRLPAGHLSSQQQVQLRNESDKERELLLLECLLQQVPPSEQLTELGKEVLQHSSRYGVPQDIVGMLSSGPLSEEEQEQLLGQAAAADTVLPLKDLLVQLLCVQSLSATELEQLLLQLIQLGQVTTLELFLPRVSAPQLPAEAAQRLAQAALATHNFRMLTSLLTQLSPLQLLPGDQLQQLLQTSIARHDLVVLQLLLDKLPPPIHALSDEQVHQLLQHALHCNDLPALQCLLVQLPAASSLPEQQVQQLLQKSMSQQQLPMLECLLCHLATAQDLSPQQIQLLLQEAIESKQLPLLQCLLQRLPAARSLPPAQLQQLLRAAISSQSGHISENLIQQFQPAESLAAPQLLELRQLLQEPQSVLPYSLVDRLLPAILPAEQLLDVLMQAMARNHPLLVHSLLAGPKEGAGILTAYQVKQLLQQAISFQQLPALLSLLPLPQVQELSETDVAELLEQPVAAGKMDMVQHLCMQLPQPTWMSAAAAQRLLQQAVRSKHLPVLQKLLRYLPGLHLLLPEQIKEVIQEAVTGQQAPALELLKEVLVVQKLPGSAVQQLAELAVAGKRVELLESILSFLPTWRQCKLGS